MKTRLRELREEKHWTLRRVASTLHISPSNLTQWERDKREMSYETLCLFADYYGVSVDYLIGHSDSLDKIEIQGTPHADLLLDEEERRVIEKYRSLDRAGRAELLARLDEFGEG